MNGPSHGKENQISVADVAKGSHFWAPAYQDLARVRTFGHMLAKISEMIAFLVRNRKRVRTFGHMLPKTLEMYAF